MTETTLSPVRRAPKRRRGKAASRAPMTYGYARVSTGAQATEGGSIDEQCTRITAKAASESWTVSHIFCDTVSGSVPLTDREAGAELMRIIEPGDHLIAPKLDRMFRSALDALTVVQDFQNRGIHLHFLDISGGDDVSGNGMSRMMLQLLAVFAEFERSRISERVAEGKRQLRSQGRHQGGKRPFGFVVGPRAEGDKKAPPLIAVPKEQAAIRKMLKMRDEGATLRAIAAAMRTRGFPLSPETVRQVLVRTEKP